MGQPTSLDMQYTILLGGPTRPNIQYYWVSPPTGYAIRDIIGWAHQTQYAILLGEPACLDMQYAILLGGPSQPNMRYYWVSPPTGYAIRDITGWAYQTQYAILLGQPTYWICNMRYYWVGPPNPIYNITGSANLLDMQYAILLVGPSKPNM
jgi:hypothetical protein